MSSVLGDTPAHCVVAVLRRANRRFGANQAVVAIVLVAGDDVAGLAAFFLDHVTPAERGRSFLIQDSQQLSSILLVLSCDIKY
ncbi:hypothetical protein EBB_05540 [Methylomonas sp. EbB]|uniref:Uncharacterized protein n=1 Tax=Methylomonas fluvii TaxID=1854564 RepID=A0ABR9DA64_9GAMM|nr:hypothetical protein [Methylomonas fluvii]